MKIKTIKKQYRRDFTAIYECEYCGNEKEASGYDDIFFHKKVIPEMICSKCGQKSPNTYRPLATKYPDDFVV